MKKKQETKNKKPFQVIQVLVQERMTLIPGAQEEALKANPETQEKKRSKVLNKGQNQIQVISKTVRVMNKASTGQDFPTRLSTGDPAQETLLNFLNMALN